MRLFEDLPCDAEVAEPASPETSAGKRALTAQIGQPGPRLTSASPGKIARTSRLAANGRPGPPPLGVLAEAQQSQGQSLPADLRSVLEQRSGQDLGQVRLHTGGAAAAAADALEASAFAFGSSVFFAAGEYAPGSAAGRQLIAHEVAHTIQQGMQQPGLHPDLQVSSTGETHETEADEFATGLTAVGPSRAAGAPSLQRHPAGQAAPGADDAPVLPIQAEHRIIALLERPVSATDVRAQQARKRELVDLFGAIVSPDREILLGRLQRPAGNDRLAQLFLGRLHRATRKALLQALRGEPVPVVVHDSVVISAFDFQLTEEVIRCAPDPIVAYDKFTPGDNARIWLQAEWGPPFGTEGVELRWTIEQPDGAELAFTRRWPAAETRSYEIFLELKTPGPHRVRVDLIDEGLLFRTLERIVEVVVPERDRDAAELLTDEQVTDQEAAHQAKLANTTDKDEQIAGIEGRIALQAAAADRGLAPPKKPDPGPEVYDLDGLPMSDRPEYIRYIFELAYAGKWPGLEYTHETAIREFYMKFYHHSDRVLHEDRRNGERSQQGALALRIRDAMDTERRQFEAERAVFCDHFARTARDLGALVLRQSEERIGQEMIRYGVQYEENTQWTVWLGVGDLYGTGPLGNQEEARDLSNTAAEVAARKRELDEIKRRRAEAQDKVDQFNAWQEYKKTNGIEDGEHPDWLWCGEDTGGIPYADGNQVWGMSCTLTEEDKARAAELVAVLDPLIAEEQGKFDLLRAEAESKHPILAVCKKGEDYDIKKLDELVAGPDALVTQSLLDAMNDNKDAQKGLGTSEDPGDLKIWKQGDLLALTKAYMGIAPGTLYDVIVDRKAAAEAGKERLKGIGLGILTLGAALLLAIPTGGASLGVATAVAVGEAAMLALDIYLALDALEQYQLEKAAAGSDFDKARALSSSEPSLFWLAVEIIGAGLGAAGAVRAFKNVAKTYRAVKSARSAGDATQALADMRGARKAAGLSDDAGRRLEDDALGELDPDVARAARGADEVASTADEAGTAGRAGDTGRAGASTDIVDTMPGTRLAGALSKGDVDELAARLGTKVEIADDLPMGAVHIDRVVDPETGRIFVKGVRAHSTAAVTDILLHGRTVQYLNEYSTLIGKLKRLWNRLVRKHGDRGLYSNPFKAGTPEFDSWVEMSKLREFVDDRLARLGTENLDEASHTWLRRDVRYLEAEINHHQRVVDDLAGDFEPRVHSPDGTGSIAYPGDTTRKALSKGYPELTNPPLKDPGNYYYRESGRGDGEFVLARYDSTASTKYRVEVVDGKKRLVEDTGMTRAEEAKSIVAGWSKADQGAWDEAVEWAKKAHPDAVVVPLKGLAKTNDAIGSLKGWAQVEGKMREILEKAYRKSGLSKTAAAIKAKEVVAKVKAHKITVVHGTDQLRAFGYRAHYAKDAGDASGDLHHIIPLQLGGDHRLLVDVSDRLHDDLHDLIDKLEFDSMTLAPADVARAPSLNFEPAAAVLLKGPKDAGGVIFKPLSEFKKKP